MFNPGLLRICLSVLLLGLFSTGAALGDDSRIRLALSAGAFDMGEEETFEGRAELRFQKVYWHLRPLMGVMASGDEAFYGYVGVLADIKIAERVHLVPSFAVGAFEPGDGLDLGHTVEFRSQIELAYELENQHRIGVSVSHMSNAGIGDLNPGQESLMLTYELPLDKLISY